MSEIIKYDLILGSYITDLKRMVHSYYDEPAYIIRNRCSYWTKGQLHREDAPAWIECTDASNKFEWFNHGKRYTPTCQKL